MGVIQGDHGVSLMLSVTVTAGADGGISHQVPGVRIGDIVRVARDTTDGHDVSMYFEPVVTSHGHIVQTRGDIAGHTIAVLMVRPT